MWISSRQQIESKLRCKNHGELCIEISIHTQTDRISWWLFFSCCYFFSFFVLLSHRVFEEWWSERKKKIPPLRKKKTKTKNKQNIIFFLLFFFGFFSLLFFFHTQWYFLYFVHAISLCPFFVCFVFVTILDWTETCDEIWDEDERMRGNFLWYEPHCLFTYSTDNFS